MLQRQIRSAVRFRIAASGIQDVCRISARCQLALQHLSRPTASVIDVDSGGTYFKDRSDLQQNSHKCSSPGSIWGSGCLQTYCQVSAHSAALLMPYSKRDSNSSGTCSEDRSDLQQNSQKCRSLCSIWGPGSLQTYCQVSAHLCSTFHALQPVSGCLSCSCRHDKHEPLTCKAPVKVVICGGSQHDWLHC